MTRDLSGYATNHISRACEFSVNPTAPPSPLINSFSCSWHRPMHRRQSWFSVQRNDLSWTVYVFMGGYWVGWPYHWCAPLELIAQTIAPFDLQQNLPVLELRLLGALIACHSNLQTKRHYFHQVSVSVRYCWYAQFCSTYRTDAVTWCAYLVRVTCDPASVESERPDVVMFACIRTAVQVFPCSR